jgi:hypothetical protein
LSNATMTSLALTLYTGSCICVSFPTDDIAGSNGKCNQSLEDVFRFSYIKVEHVVLLQMSTTRLP